MGHGVQPRGRARIAGDEHQVPFLRAAFAPLQVLRGLRRLAVLVGAEEGDVEVVARELEVIRVAAEEGDGVLGCEHEPDIRVFLVRVEMIPTPAIQGDDVAAQAGPVERLLLDLRPGLPSGLGGCGVVHPLGDPRVHAIGDVDDADEHVQFQVGRLDLLLPGASEEAVLEIVLRGRADLVQGVGGDVVVGHHQALRRDERARPAAVEPHGSRPDLGDPLRRRLEAVEFLELSDRQVVEGPHPLIGPDARRAGQDRQPRQDQELTRRVLQQSRDRRCKAGASHHVGDS